MSDNWDNMTHEARELFLYIENNADLYRQMYEPIIKNYMRKRARGIFNKELAIKGFMNLVDEGARRYTKEFGTPGDPISQIFPKPARLEVARELTDRFIAEAELGNYDDVLKRTEPNPNRAAISRISPLWGGGTFPTFIQQFPTGLWGVVGSCPVSLNKKYFKSREEITKALNELGYINTEGDKFVETQLNPRLLYEVNPNYWDVPKLIQDLRAMGVKFTVVERGRLRTDIIPKTEADYHRIWSIHHDSGRDYRRAGYIVRDIIRSDKRFNPRGRPKIDRALKADVISSSPPYYTADGFVLYHDEKGKRFKVAIGDFENITTPEDQSHGQYKFKVRNVKKNPCKKNPRPRIEHYYMEEENKNYRVDRKNLRLVDPKTGRRKIQFHSKLEMDEYLSTGNIATFPSRNKMTRIAGPQHQVECKSCGTKFTIRFKGKGKRAKRYLKNCPECGSLLEVQT